MKKIRRFDTTKLLLMLFGVGCIMWFTGNFSEFIGMLATFIGIEIVDRWAYDKDEDDDDKRDEETGD